MRDWEIPILENEQWLVAVCRKIDTRWSNEEIVATRATKMRLKPELGIMIKIALAVGTFLTSYGIAHADEVTPPPRGGRRRSPARLRG